MVAAASPEMFRGSPLMQATPNDNLFEEILMWALILLACLEGIPCYPIGVLAIVKNESLCEEIIGLEAPRLKDDQALMCIKREVERPDEKT